MEVGDIGIAQFAAGFRRFTPQGTQGGSVKELNYRRNRFTHFFPTGLALEVSGLPYIALDCIEIIWFIAFDSGHIYFEGDEQEEEVKFLIKEIMEKLTQIQSAH
jgi:hypothetical protein